MPKMREVAFIKQNAPEWEKLEGIIKARTAISADELSALYIKLQDDLAYARTYYPKSNTTKYLNELTGHFHRSIYKNKRERSNRIIAFWKYEVPYAVLKSHKQLLYSLVLFLVSVLIGIISSAHDDDFVRLILGDSYVNKTLENIHQGDPMGVYNSIYETQMFFAISTNNIYVSFCAYVFGIFGAIGTAYFLFTNGIMLGAFQYFFYEKHLLLLLILAIYLSGAFWSFCYCHCRGCRICIRQQHLVSRHLFAFRIS